MCCRLFDINVKAVINVTQVVAKGMIKKGQGGSIVNISSQASKVNLCTKLIVTMMGYQSLSFSGLLTQHIIKEILMLNVIC